MNAYFDTSAFASLVLQDDRSSDLDRWLQESRASPFTSDFGWGEFVSAVSIRTRTMRHDADRHAATLALGDRILASWTVLHLTSRDLRMATDLVSRFELSLRLPDAVHVVLAERTGALLVTADRQQARAANALGLAIYPPLEDAA